MARVITLAFVECRDVQIIRGQEVSERNPDMHHDLEPMVLSRQHPPSTRITQQS